MLSRFREMDPEDEMPTLTADEMYEGLMTDRVVSRHIRSLLKRAAVGSRWTMPMRCARN